jgi:hypothetical protein
MTYRRTPGIPPTSAAAEQWPTGPLDAAQRAFDLLTRPPAPLSFDCRTIPGLPQRIVGLDQLRTLLVDGDPRSAHRRSPATDAVWHELVTRARRDGPAWVVAAVGVALPGLRRRAGLLSRGWHGDIADLDSELLLGFLERLRSIDLDEPNICSRLIDAGARAVRRAREHDDEADVVHTDLARSLPPARPWDHPDFVLARAVHTGTITARDADLIGRTRLDGDTLVHVADELDVPISTVTSWRARAEKRLATAIAEGELRWTQLPATG